MSASVPRGGRLRHILHYGNKVFRLGELLGQVRDSRKNPRIRSNRVARIVFLLGLLRIRSFNALEPQLSEPWMQSALGERFPKEAPICSVDTLAYALQRMDVSTTRGAVVEMIQKAERNKVFREGWFGAMRFVAIDGWEPLSSYERCCSACLSREVKTEQGVRTQYYHRYVIAFLLDARLNVVLDMEPIRSADARADLGETDIRGHEGELSAAKRLVPRLRSTYGRWLDVLVVDALYANGPFLGVAKQSGFGVIAVLKKSHEEPLREALDLWKGEPAKSIVDDESGEEIALWDCPQIQTLMSYDGPIRVVRAIVSKSDTKRTWCFAVTGKATRLSADRVLRAGRARWHIENTAFHQFTQHWPFAHVFTHGPAAIPALFWLFFLAFNLTQLFVYRQLEGYGRDRGRDRTRTFRRLVDEMRADLARLDDTLGWDSS